MVKKTKTGKQRKDRFYKLAKETGYRSRASFKLIQLNRKFEFLQKSRVLIDLCAAPGGWLQVAQQSMPVSSVIIGVDLVSIKQIPNVITLQEDITTDRCRQSLKKQLKTWKADIVLHDGAPNMGKSWLQDAFSQNQLTLSALKLATELLVKGGWFISKVFRSRDHLALVWVLKKLFRKVHVTKPQASRNESAEVFVVCEGYVAPDRIDPKFLDLSHVFKDVESKGETKANILNITKRKQKAEGYDGEASVFSKLKASDFIFGSNHLEMLSNCNEIIFDDVDIEDHKFTTKEIKECCKDIKVLGRGDLRSLLSWRKQLQAAAKQAEVKTVESDKADEVPDEEKEINDALKEAEELDLEKLQVAKRKKKKMLKERRKEQERINLKMIIKDDEPIIDEDRELFKLMQIKSKKDLTKIQDEDDLEFGADNQVAIEDPNEMRSYRSNFESYDRYNKYLTYNDDPEASNDDDSSDEDNNEPDLEYESESEQDNLEDNEEEEEHPLFVDIVTKSEKVQATVTQWFDKEDFANMDDGNDLDLELLAEKLEKKKLKKEKIITNKRNINDIEDVKEKTPGKTKMAKHVSFSGNVIEKEYLAEDDAAGETSFEEIEKPKPKKKKKIKLDPEGLALGALIVQSKKMRRDIADNAYNRFASNDENLPDWFVRDEEEHYRKEMPVTAEMVREYKERLREINARPIKKVIEARARNKRRALKKMAKARKKALAVTDDLQMGEKEKAEQLQHIYKRAQVKKDNHVTYVVGKKGGGRKARRPAGVKGRFKVVDKRMKKDDRVRKQSAKKERKMNKQKPPKGKKK